MDRRDAQALDRHITGNYGEDGVASEGVLSDECEAILEREEWYSQASKFPAGRADVRDIDGERLFSVTLGIDACDLLAIIAHGKRQYTRGEDWGAFDTKRRLRDLLDVPANPQEPA